MNLENDNLIIYKTQMIFFFFSIRNDILLFVEGNCSNNLNFCEIKWKSN
jgi:hypothetical protein